MDYLIGYYISRRSTFCSVHGPVDDGVGRCTNINCPLPGRKTSGWLLQLMLATNQKMFCHDSLAQN